jgi:hypothetical protein
LNFLIVFDFFNFDSIKKDTNDNNIRSSDNNRVKRSAKYQITEDISEDNCATSCKTLKDVVSILDDEPHQHAPEGLGDNDKDGEGVVAIEHSFGLHSLIVLNEHADGCEEYLAKR